MINGTVSDTALNLKKTCPCGRGERADLERIRRTTFMKIFLFWLPIKRYKCYNCKRNKWIISKA
jgi:hypothetical protein